MSEPFDEIIQHFGPIKVHLRIGCHFTDQFVPKCIENIRVPSMVGNQF